MTQGSRNYHIGNPNDGKHSPHHPLEDGVVVGELEKQTKLPRYNFETTEKSRWIGLIPTSIPQTRLQRMELMSTS